MYSIVLNCIQRKRGPAGMPGHNGGDQIIFPQLSRAQSLPELFAELRSVLSIVQDPVASVLISLRRR
jgi:hypothetical protein